MYVLYTVYISFTVKNLFPFTVNTIQTVSSDNKPNCSRVDIEFELILELELIFELAKQNIY